MGTGGTERFGRVGDRLKSGVVEDGAVMAVLLGVSLGDRLRIGDNVAYTCKLSVTEYGTFYWSIEIYNYLPRRIKDISDFTLFKKTVSSILIDSVSYSI